MRFGYECKQNVGVSETARARHFPLLMLHIVSEPLLILGKSSNLHYIWHAMQSPRVFVRRTTISSFVVGHFQCKCMAFLVACNFFYCSDQKISQNCSKDPMRAERMVFNIFSFDCSKFLVIIILNYNDFCCCCCLPSMLKGDALPKAA